MKNVRTRMIAAFLICLSGLFSLFTGCEKNSDTSGLSINAGYACGWGAGQDSIEISRYIIKYVYYVPSQSSLPLIRTSRSVTESEWNEITDSFNLEAFNRLKYNECNICVDGCDEWISVKNIQMTHSIRYSKGLVIADVSRLQKILADFRSEFNPI
jgi:hypothetical protein